MEGIRLSQFCEHLLIGLPNSLEYSSKNVFVHSLTIHEYQAIQTLHPQAIAFVSSFCLNRWLLEQKPPFKISALEEKTSIEYWIKCGQVKALNYSSLIKNNDLVGELLLAIAKNWLVIGFLKTNTRSLNLEAGAALSIQLAQCINFSKKFNLRGLSTTIPNPSYYPYFTKFGFSRDVACDTGLPVPFSLKLN